MLYALIRFVMDGVAELMSRLFGCVACAAVLLASSPALASVALSCSIADKMLDLTLEGTISRGVGEGLISVKGEAKANIEMLSGELRAFTFERGEITQYWLGGQNLKLRLYRETAVEPHETLDIVIDVRSKGDPDAVDYKGSYSASASSMAGVAAGEAKTVTFKGRASCQVE